MHGPRRFDVFLEKRAGSVYIGFMEPGRVFLFLFLADAVVNVAANIDEEKNRMLVYVTKPLLMPLLVAYYAFSCDSVSVLLVTALGFGFLGDVFLMLPDRGEKMFMAGVAAFLFNQLLYVVAFLRTVESFGAMPAWLPLLLVPYLAYGFSFYRLIRPGLGGMKVPVIAYMAVILCMGAAALLRRAEHAGASFWLVLGGSISFIASDSTLAFDKFKREVPFGRAVVMATYIAAQLLIVRGLMA